MDCGFRFFYALEKKGGAKKHVLCLLAEDSTPHTDPAEMCGRARAFYAGLFSPDPTDPNACRVLWNKLLTVSADDRDQLELPLILAEFLEALRRMPTNKSLGMGQADRGVLPRVLGHPRPRPSHRLGRVFAERGPLSFVQASRARLLPKKGDLRDLRNWCPVSLLSMDYKVAAKAISLRLGSVLVDVIHPDQTYTVPHRIIFDNLYLVRDLLELECREGLSFALLSLDQEKAFDRVDHGYLLGTLRAFGLGPQFVGFLQVLYASAECLVRLNWTLTELVSFGRGVRQRCSLSGQLYALAIEPFLCLLRRRLTGLALREPELRLVLLAYAEDVLLVVQDPGDLAQVEACQAMYSAASSARVNWVKSSGLVVGDWRQASSLPPVLQANQWSAGDPYGSGRQRQLEPGMGEQDLLLAISQFVQLFSPNLRLQVLGVSKAVPGRLLHLQVRMEGLVVNLVNIYAPTSGPERLHFFQQASTFLGTLDPRECLVLGGDFNTNLKERDHSGTEQCLATADVLREIVDHHSLVDVWCDHHPDDVSTFTFVWVEAHRSHHSWLDHIYLSCFHLSPAHSSSIRPAPFSDHNLATVTASLCAYWHFNNSLLQDVGFVTSFQEFWLAQQGQRHAFPSAQRWWDLGKVRAQLFCHDYTRGASRRRDAAIGQLEWEVLELERHLATSPKDPSLCGACREKWEELRALEDHRVRGAFV
ncbi:unnamed protein product [Caretta caretta]